jgi:antitoxin (DNA-binding transcriptional repressor) of toxin-antitoxin stability system
MKTLTVEEATPGLGRLVDLALAGEQIQICKGKGVVELRPANTGQPAAQEQLTPREALRRLQAEGRLTPAQADRYLNEVREERLAADDQDPA